MNIINNGPYSQQDRIDGWLNKNRDMIGLVQEKHRLTTLNDASTGLVLVRCWQYRPITGRVLAHTGMFTGYIQVNRL